MSRFYATGRRKKAIARVWLSEGSGEFDINQGKDLKTYFYRDNLCMIIRQPLVLTNALSRYKIRASVKGGGLSGQAEALRHGISRALSSADSSLKTHLRKAGFLTRDPRMKERKKYGQKGARRSFQFTKR